MLLHARKAVVLNCSTLAVDGHVEPDGAEILTRWMGDVGGGAFGVIGESAIEEICGVDEAGLALGLARST